MNHINTNKMNKLFSMLALVATAFSLHAQITVTDATFPAVGDTLRTAIDQEPAGIEITPPGGPFAWDFTGLIADANQVTVFHPASEGEAFANFSEAELVIFGQAGAETYFSVSPTAFENLGYSGTAPAGGFPIQTEFKFTPPVPERRAPLNFIDNFLTGSSLKITMPIDSALAAILAQFGIPTGLVDSLRIQGDATRVEIVDAYGSLSIPGGAYDVLREKRTEYRETHLEVHTLIGWIDVTNQVGTAGGFGTDTIATYHFLSNTEKEPIAIVTVDYGSLAPTRVEYKDNGLPSATGFVAAAMPKVLVSPNPASDEAVFELQDFAPGSYSLRLLDAQGGLVMVKKLLPGVSLVPLAGLADGTYFYQVLDENDRIRSSGKLLKINK